MTQANSHIRARGRCLCGGVTYEVRGPLRDVVACHCDECRRFTGGSWAATAAMREHLAISDAGGLLKWHRNSSHARRGFCGRCGSSLFFDPEPAAYMAIAMGTLEKPTGLRLAVHIFVHEAGDYYAIDDDLPKLTDANHGLKLPEN